MNNDILYTKLINELDPNEQFKCNPTNNLTIEIETGQIENIDSKSNESSKTKNRVLPFAMVGRRLKHCSSNR